MCERPSVLDSITVRLIERDEKDLWRQKMESYHYLGYTGIVGNYLLYVAILNDQWFALIGWCSASLKIKARDSWIGWDNLKKRQRLKMIVNNFRFLILPGIQIKNAASKILALNIKRLPQDWQVAFGDEIVLAETFVDPTLFKGICYLASGWKYLGDTKGYSRTSGGYRCNYRPKNIFIKELKRNSRVILTDPFFVTDGGDRSPMIDFFSLPIEGSNGLICAINNLKDHRSRQGRRYSRIFLLAVIIGALLEGAQCYDDIEIWSKNLSISELKRLRSRDGSSASKITFERLILNIDVEAFDSCIERWINQHIRKETMDRIQGFKILESFINKNNSLSGRPAKNLSPTH